jgi:hypothetical protein
VRPEPADDELKACAGSPSHGRVLVREVLGDVAAAVVDTNGDGRFQAVVVLHRGDDGGWRESGWSDAGLVGESSASGVFYAYGRAPGTTSVEVGHRGTWRAVPVGADGWWLVLAPADERERFDLSRVPAPPSAPSTASGGEPRIAG